MLLLWLVLGLVSRRHSFSFPHRSVTVTPVAMTLTENSSFPGVRHQKGWCLTIESWLKRHTHWPCLFYTVSMVITDDSFFFAEKTPYPWQLLVLTAMCCNNSVTKSNCTKVFPVLKFQRKILWYLKETLTRVRFCHLLCRIKNNYFLHIYLPY